MEIKIFKPKVKDIPYDLTGIFKDLKQVDIIDNCKKYYVYFLSCKNGEVLYVGKTTDIRGRLLHHKKTKDFDKIFIIESDKDSYEDLEKKWQIKLLPKLCQDVYLIKHKRKQEEYNINAWNNLVDSFALNFVTGKKYNEKIKKYKEKYESSKQTKRQ